MRHVFFLREALTCLQRQFRDQGAWTNRGEAGRHWNNFWEEMYRVRLVRLVRLWLNMLNEFRVLHYLHIIWFHLVSPLHSRQCPTVTTDPPATPRRCSGKVRAGRASSDTQHQDAPSIDPDVPTTFQRINKRIQLTLGRLQSTGCVQLKQTSLQDKECLLNITQHPFVAVNSSFQVPLCYDSHCHLLSSAVKGKVDSS